MGIEHLVHRRNEASLNLFYRYCFGRCSSELADLVPPLPNSGWASSRVFNILQDFSITVPRCYGDVCEQILSSQARLCNSLPAEYFSLAYDLNGFISRFNRHFFVFRFFLSKQLFLFSFIFFFSFSPTGWSYYLVFNKYLISFNKVQVSIEVRSLISTISFCTHIK